ncbi:MAG: phenylacetate--CoA ligase family protein, partial [Gemmataceae bacterium]
MMGEGLLFTLREAFASRKPARVAERQRARLAEVVAHARADSPYYRELYRDLPERVEDPTLLPVTSKRELMARFDAWATDREVTIDKARAFAENPDLIGERFLDRYTLDTTSGTTGTPGIFVLDDPSMAVTKAMAVRTLRAWLGVGDLARILVRGRRMAMTIASGSHSATAVAAVRLRKSASGQKRVLALSVHTPLPEMVARLNEFRPAVLAPYASIARLLAGEQEAGRLKIDPVLMVLAAEGLPISEYDRIARVFDAKVETSYAATECMFFSYGCGERWLHVNSDWAVLEPVDADYRPVPPGEQSHTVLLSNLANRVQPVLRYDLGDSVVMRPDP